MGLLNMIQGHFGQMFCFDVFLPFKHLIGSSSVPSGGGWISGLSGGSTVPKLGSGSSARLFLSLLLQHFITHTSL